MKLINKSKYKIPKIWFYDVKGVEDVATRNELKIANKLSKLKSNIFLESRAYMRQSLSTIFNIDPLEIPITANPGEPPKLPKGMGNISLSHCKDAILIAWHEHKIGIDIERIDREFNHEKLAKKYFCCSSQENNIEQIKKHIILNKWCAIEAATKWNHGKLSEDIKEWEYFVDKNKLVHKKKNLSLKHTQINFHKWIISLAYEETAYNIPHIICCSNKF